MQLPLLPGKGGPSVAVGTGVDEEGGEVTGVVLTVNWGTAVVVGTDGDVNRPAPAVAVGAAVAAGVGVGVSPVPVSCSPEGRVGAGVAAVVVTRDDGTGPGMYGEGDAAADEGLGIGEEPAKVKQLIHSNQSLAMFMCGL